MPNVLQFLTGLIATLNGHLSLVKEARLEIGDPSLVRFDEINLLRIDNLAIRFDAELPANLSAPVSPPPPLSFTDTSGRTAIVGTQRPADATVGQPASTARLESIITTSPIRTGLHFIVDDIELLPASGRPFSPVPRVGLLHVSGETCRFKTFNHAIDEEIQLRCDPNGLVEIETTRHPHEWIRFANGEARLPDGDVWRFLPLPFNSPKAISERPPAVLTVPFSGCTRVLSLERFPQGRAHTDPSEIYFLFW